MNRAHNSLSTNTINWLAAIIIALFLIFPDIARNYEERDVQHESFMPPPPPNNSNEIPPPYGAFETKPSESPKHKDFPTEEFAFHKIVSEFIFYFAFALLLLSLNTLLLKHPFNNSFLASNRTIVIIIANLIITFSAQYFIHLIKIITDPFFDIQRPPFKVFTAIETFKSLFVAIITILISHLMHNLLMQQEIKVEVERLKSENLRNRFDALTSQMNPHFFFNSLNALSGLVRTNKNESALKYINQLSKIFRYILIGNWQELVPLADEIKFLDAYRYLLEIRYGNRLQFSIQLSNDELANNRLPYLSLQPVIENVIKHNTISSHYPMNVNIANENGKLTVRNIIRKKIETEPSSGIGLSNLSKRYKLIADQEISWYIDNDVFIVELPLISHIAEQNESINH